MRIVDSEQLNPRHENSTLESGVDRMDIELGMKMDVRRRAGIERELASRIDQRVLRWFEHVERMDE